MILSKDYNKIAALRCIQMNSSTISLALSNNYGIGLFTGTVPTDQQLLNMLGNNVNPTMNAAAVSAFASADNFLGAAIVPSGSQTVMDLEALSMRFPFSELDKQFNIVKAGVPTWFMCRYTYNTSGVNDTSFTGFVAGTYANLMIIGTVGDENSDADMKIVGGSVAVGVPTRLSDMIIRFK